MAKLFLFDIDDTICNRDSTDIYPEALDLLARTTADFALVTNQGGPACHDAGWDFSDKFPSLEEVQKRLVAIGKTLFLFAGINPAIYVAYAYKQENGKVIVPKSEHFVFTASIDESWRKPNPGMLHQAMADFQVRPHECLMVGDREEDRLAAEAAGVAFVWAKEFFGRAK